MKLDFIENVSEFEDSVVRLYNFGMEEAIKFRNLIENLVLNRKTKLDLSMVDFIESRNCNLILGLFHTDEGILSADNTTFYCMLTEEGYAELLKRIEPFCHKQTKSYRYLYEIDNPIDFLFSPAGTW